uniref:Serine-threonine/tyrosine-protein kinase catalytic domain-containing protein n=1 Tax=Nymphaea colorata TaxID=210225 RepID=A0A5K1HXZ9_9MAGN|nr:unnamed protein product [Nymphaea colorata]
MAVDAMKIRSVTAFLFGFASCSMETTSRMDGRSAGHRVVQSSATLKTSSIVDWVRNKIQTKEGVVEVLDKDAGADCGSVREEMLLVLRVALLCTTRCPADRPSMRDVVSMLQEAKPKRKAVNTSDLHGIDSHGVNKS